MHGVAARTNKCWVHSAPDNACRRKTKQIEKKNVQLQWGPVSGQTVLEHLEVVCSGEVRMPGKLPNSRNSFELSRLPCS